MLDYMIAKYLPKRLIHQVCSGMVFFVLFRLAAKTAFKNAFCCSLAPSPLFRHLSFEILLPVFCEIYTLAKCFFSTEFHRKPVGVVEFKNVCTSHLSACQFL